MIVPTCRCAFLLLSCCSKSLWATLRPCKKNFLSQNSRQNPPCWLVVWLPFSKFSQKYKGLLSNHPNWRTPSFSGWSWPTNQPWISMDFPPLRPVDETSIPTGELRAVTGAMDLRQRGEDRRRGSTVQRPGPLRRLFWGGHGEWWGIFWRICRTW